MKRYKDECNVDGDKLSYTDNCKTKIHTETHTIIEKNIRGNIQ